MSGQEPYEPRTDWPDEVWAEAFRRHATSQQVLRHTLEEDVDGLPLGVTEHELTVRSMSVKPGVLAAIEDEMRTRGQLR